VDVGDIILQEPNMLFPQLALLAAAVTTASPVHTSGVPASSATTAACCAAATRIGPDSLRVRAALAEAEALAFAGRFTEAQRRYKTLIAEQRAAHQYPGAALWGLANSYLDKNSDRAVVSVLDELAQAAAEFGDPTMELRATFESAVIHQHLRERERVADLMTRVRALLQSPAITSDAKREIEDRIAGA
jgi:hypothetical protein